MLNESLTHIRNNNIKGSKHSSAVYCWLLVELS